MLTSIPDHADYLERFHAPENNHKSSEMRGLATIAVCWPEFKNSQQWYDYSMKQNISTTYELVYPDGAQKELTSLYHLVTVYELQGVVDLLQRAGKKPPVEFMNCLEKMYNYLAYTIRPDGYSLLNNDSDRLCNRDKLLKAAAEFNRPDWTYIVTNGHQGTKPQGLPSVFFNWAGQLVMRNGWNSDAQWAFFDVGPAGLNHNHADKLHISVAAYGRDLLVDSGRYIYVLGSWWEYFVGSPSHNVILIDGGGQNWGIKVVDKPTSDADWKITPTFDYARGTFESGFQGISDKITHTRAVMYVRGKYWIVVDRIETAKPHDIQVLWHYNPDCKVKIESDSVASVDANKGNLRIVPVSAFPWQLKIVKGQTSPEIQGWWSREYNQKEPNPTAIYSARIDKPATFAWVLVPALGKVPAVKAEIIETDSKGVRVRFCLDGGQPVEVFVPLQGNEPILHMTGCTQKIAPTKPAANYDPEIVKLCNDYPDRITKLFDNLNLDYKGMELVKAAVEAKNYPAACTELVDYYSNVNHINQPQITPSASKIANDAVADKILKDTFTFQLVEGTVPRLPNGRLDWAYLGPKNEKEWGWFLNRHYHLRGLLKIYQKTSNPAYVKYIDQHVQDWIISNPYPGKSSGTSQWRGLEICFRVMNWAEVFYGLQHNKEFTPAARILMLTSIPEHADYLKRFHQLRGNWVASEMRGLATAAIGWPEFKDSQRWYDYSMNQMKLLLTNVLYPDGAEKELTSHYHLVTANELQGLVDLLRQAGKKPPVEFMNGLEKMYNYLAYTIRPDGYSLLNNDSDRLCNRDKLLKAAAEFNRPDWIYIVTNGHQGTKPQGLPSVFFNWAGQLIMRNGWNSDAQWAFFDIGPAGLGHYHADKLHISVAAYGRDLLVDGGRYTYAPVNWRGYFNASPSHNVILIDGRGQNFGVTIVDKPTSDADWKIAPAFDYARGTFDSGFQGISDKITHTRAVMYVRGKYWIVVDHIETAKPHDIQVLWHYNPDCKVKIEGDSVASVDANKGNLRIVPVSAFPWQLKIVKGQTSPEIQGWWSREYNQKEPNPTAIYSARIDKPATFAWVLVPALGKVPAVKAEIVETDSKGVRVRFCLDGGQPVEVFVPLQGNEPIIYPSTVSALKS